MGIWERESLTKGSAGARGLGTRKKLLWPQGNELGEVRLEERPGGKLDHVGSHDFIRILTIRAWAFTTVINDASGSNLTLILKESL